MNSINTFENDIIKLEEKIVELKKVSQDNDLDLANEIEALENKLESMKEEYYKNLTPWQKVQIARHQKRPTTLDYIGYLFEDFIELHGDRYFGDDKAIVGGIATFEGQPVTVIGHQKGQNTKENIIRNFGMPHPEGYRKALRLMQQANKFNRPIITFINTPGAYPGMESEERGISEAIARNLREMASFGVPIINIVIGEGGSGGALALGVGNHIYMLENSFYSVISPEGAAALLWKNAKEAQRAAETMKITADNLLNMGIIDGIVPEVKGGSHLDPKAQAEYIKKFIKQSLEELSKLSREELIEHRFEKFRNMGEFKVL